MDIPVIVKKGSAIYDFVGHYTVDESGNIYSIKNSCKASYHVTKKTGYVTVRLSKKDFCATFLVHRVVADAFIVPDETKPCINHKDGDKENNALSNLERVTYSENEKHSYRVLGKKPVKTNLGKVGKLCPFSKPVLAIKDGQEKHFESIKLAAESLGVFDSNIAKVLKGKYKHSGGYFFKYA